MNGCSYKLVSTQKLEALDARMVDLENNLSHSINQELDRRLTQHDEKLQSSFEKYFVENNATLNTLHKELITLIKAENVKRKKRPKKVAKVVTRDIKKLLVGRVEKVHIYPSDLVMNARIDTGAETSSINAGDITEFERDGKKWVRFTLYDEKANTPHILERRVVRRVKILQSSLEEDFEKRVVVTLKITIGNKNELSEFTLTSRDHMTYPILIGRNVLRDLIVVDVSERYIAPLVLSKEDEFKK